MPYSGFLSFQEEEETLKPKENLTANVTKWLNSTTSSPKKKRAVVPIKN